MRYLRSHTDNHCHVSLIAANTSVLSSYEVARDSTPRKKLIAHEIGTRLLKESLESTSLPIERYEMWTDSQTVIKWCSSKTLELRAFERNRVDLILKRNNGKVPRYVPTDQNPTDVATRGYCLNNKERWDLWTGGPCFLCCPAAMDEVDLSTIEKRCTTEVMSATQSKQPNCA